MSVHISWNSMGPTPTPTLGNIMIQDVNKVPHCTDPRQLYESSFCTSKEVDETSHNHRDDPREEKRACLTSRRTSRRGSACVRLVASWTGKSPATPVRKSARMSVSVSMSVPWNSSYRDIFTVCRRAKIHTSPSVRKSSHRSDAKSPILVNYKLIWLYMQHYDFLLTIMLISYWD